MTNIKGRLSSPFRQHHPQQQSAFNHDNASFVFNCFSIFTSYFIGKKGKRATKNIYRYTIVYISLLDHCLIRYTGPSENRECIKTAYYRKLNVQRALRAVHALYLNNYYANRKFFDISKLNCARTISVKLLNFFGVKR